jgi:GNAT superfamily N-acetyltransferase
MTFRIRDAVPDDAVDIARVRAAGWRQAYGHVLSERVLDLIDSGIERNAAWWSEYLERGNTIHVLEVDGQIRGFSIGGEPEHDEKPRGTQLMLLYTLESEYGTGAGQALLDAAIGDKPAFLWTAENNPRANAFYSRNRFVPDGAREVRADLDDLVEIRMVRD